MQQENQGQLKAVLNGVGCSTGDVVCLLDADDVYMPNHLQEEVSTFEDFPRLGMRFNDVETFNN